MRRSLVRGWDADLAAAILRRFGPLITIGSASFRGRSRFAYVSEYNAVLLPGPVPGQPAALVHELMHWLDVWGGYDLPALVGQLQ